MYHTLHCDNCHTSYCHNYYFYILSNVIERELGGNGFSSGWQGCPHKNQILPPLFLSLYQLIFFPQREDKFVGMAVISELPAYRKPWNMRRGHRESGLLILTIYWRDLKVEDMVGTHVQQELDNQKIGIWNRLTLTSNPNQISYKDIRIWCSMLHYFNIPIWVQYNADCCRS